jgi:hypothetical protein
MGGPRPAPAGRGRPRWLTRRPLPRALPGSRSRLPVAPRSSRGSRAPRAMPERDQALALAGHFGDNLRRVRRREDLSQEGGEACLLRRTEIGLLEQGERVCRIDTLIRRAGAMAVRRGSCSTGSPGSPAPNQTEPSALDTDDGDGIMRVRGRSPGPSPRAASACPSRPCPAATRRARRGRRRWR